MNSDRESIRRWVRAAMNAAFLVAWLLIAACSAQQQSPPVPPGGTVRVLPVKNLAGVTLRVPEMWLGDIGEKAAGLEVELIDLRLLAEAGIRARLAQSGRSAGESRYELHAAISRFGMDEVRSTGRITLGLAVVLVDADTQGVLIETETVQDFQLMDRPPSETGMIGEQRFIRRRMEMFCEELASTALRDLGL